MKKIILITGATDGIGFETAKSMVLKGHHVIVHGRNPEKLKAVGEQLSNLESSGFVESIIADLSSIAAVKQMISELKIRFDKLDVLINNAGVFATPAPVTSDKLDVRFVVNTYAPYLLATELLPLLGATGRVVNLSSAAQSSVNLDAMSGLVEMSDREAYSQSKLAITMWSRLLGIKLKETGPMVVSVNPKSLLGSKMVRDAFGVAGSDLSVGVDILERASFSEEFSRAHGLYFDNDLEQFSNPHPDALNDEKSQKVVETMKRIIQAF
ncbi:SDR family NAD(P)-dependent oxidoreductase [Vibrio makurazakiensis]|uniref:SDR family NAD(P)-dependent oxidoreductase n=1 Tax=Vibrio makurazakiensis TaxID=2910250 RepID=UPI003D0E9E78